LAIVGSCRQFLDPVEGEIELNLKRLLAAKRAVVVEDRYALGWRREFGASRLCHTCDKVEDRGFCGGVVPRGKRLGINHEKVRPVGVRRSKWFQVSDNVNRANAREERTTHA
jgi:hypothetical protein